MYIVKRRNSPIKLVPEVHEKSGFNVIHDLLGSGCLTRPGEELAGRARAGGAGLGPRAPSRVLLILVGSAVATMPMVEGRSGAEERGQSLVQGQHQEPDASDVGMSRQLIEQARMLLELRRLKMAELRLLRAADNDRSTGKASFMLGLLHASEYGDMPEAAKHFREAAAREPGNGEAFNNLAVCNYLADRTAGIAEQFRSALLKSDDSKHILENIRAIIAEGSLNQQHMKDLVEVFHGHGARGPQESQEVHADPAGETTLATAFISGNRSTAVLALVYRPEYGLPLRDQGVKR